MKEKDYRERAWTISKCSRTLWFLPNEWWE